jgi:hypothetical protein
MLVKFKLMKLVAAIVVLLTLVSCYQSGNKATVAMYRGNISNDITVDEMTKKYGNFSSTWKDQKGNDVYQYVFFRNHYNLVSHLPIINHFGWVISRNYEVILTFDSNKSLIDQQKFYNKAKSKNGLVCNPRVYSCLRKVL